MPQMEMSLNSRGVVTVASARHPEFTMEPETVKNANKTIDPIPEINRRQFNETTSVEFSLVNSLNQLKSPKLDKGLDQAYETVAKCIQKLDEQSKDLSAKRKSREGKTITTGGADLSSVSGKLKDKRERVIYSYRNSVHHASSNADKMAKAKNFIFGDNLQKTIILPNTNAFNEFLNSCN